VAISGSVYTEAIFKTTFPHWILTAVALISGTAAGAAYGALKSRKRRAK